MISWRNLENNPLSSLHELLQNREQSTTVVFAWIVAEHSSEGVWPPFPLSLHTHTYSRAGSVTINAKTTVHCSPGSSMGWYMDCLWPSVLYCFLWLVYMNCELLKSATCYYRAESHQFTCLKPVRRRRECWWAMSRCLPPWPGVWHIPHPELKNMEYWGRILGCNWVYLLAIHFKKFCPNSKKSLLEIRLSIRVRNFASSNEPLNF